MGRSLRRAKKTRPTLTVRSRKKPRTKARIPIEITAQRPALEAKLGVTPDWDREKPLTSNYKRNRFCNDPNTGFGRNAKPDAPQVNDDDDEAAESDDDLRAAEGKERRSGKAPLQKLTTHQRQVVERLRAAHGDDIEAMVRDRKRNPMLLTAAKLRRMLAAFDSRGANDRCRFRVPNKRLW